MNDPHETIEHILERKLESAQYHRQRTWSINISFREVERILTALRGRTPDGYASIIADNATLKHNATRNHEDVARLKDQHLQTKLALSFVTMRLGRALQLSRDLDGATLEEFTRAAEAEIDTLRRFYDLNQSLPPGHAPHSK